MSKSKNYNCSFSAQSVYESCERKYWFSKVIYLPALQKSSTQIGEVLHRVAEIYLRCDDLNIDPVTKKPMALYPEMDEETNLPWYRIYNKFTEEVCTITPAERNTVKQLITDAIDKRTLLRDPESQVEYGFSYKLFTLEDGTTIHAKGEIDHCFGWTIEDHKSCGNYRYTKTEDPKCPRYLGKDPQILLYAYIWCTLRAERLGIPLPDYVTLRHNQFNKSTGIATRVEAKVPFRKCEERFVKFKELAMEMYGLRDKELDYKKLDNNGKRSCNNYGGCEFKKICTGAETLEMYKTRIEKIINVNKPKKENNMAGGFANASKAAEKNLAGTAAQKDVLKDMGTADTKAKTTTTKVTTTTKTDQLVPLPDQLLSVGAEITKLITTMEAADMSPEEALATKKGKALVEKREGIEKQLQELEAEKIKKDEEAVAKALADTKAKDAVAEQPTKPKETPSEVAQAGDLKIVAQSADRTKGVELNIGCIRVSGKIKKSIHITEVLEQLKVHVSEKFGKKFYEVKNYDRQNLLCQNVEDVITALGDVVIIAPARMDGDCVALTQAIQSKGVKTYMGTQ